MEERYLKWIFLLVMSSGLIILFSIPRLAFEVIFLKHCSVRIGMGIIYSITGPTLPVLAEHLCQTPDTVGWILGLVSKNFTENSLNLNLSRIN